MGCSVHTPLSALASRTSSQAQAGFLSQRSPRTVLTFHKQTTDIIHHLCSNCYALLDPHPGSRMSSSTCLLHFPIRTRRARGLAREGERASSRDLSPLCFSLHCCAVPCPTPLYPDHLLPPTSIKSAPPPSQRARRMAPHHHHQRSSSASLSLTDAHRRGSNADLYLDFADDQGHRTSSTVAPFGDRSSLTSSEATAYDDSAGEGDEIDLDREDDGGYYVSGAEAEKRGVMKSLGKLTGGGGGGGTSPYERLLPPLPVELSPGALGWEEKRSHLGRGRLGGRRGGRCCMMTGLVLLVGVGGWLMGLASGDEELRQTVGGVKEALQG